MVKEAVQDQMTYNPQGYANLVRAIMMDTVADIRNALDHMNFVHFVDDTGRSPLHIAALHERRNAVEPLIKAGVDPNQISGDGVTALDIAAEHDPAIYQQMIKIVKNEQQRKTRTKMTKTQTSFKKTIVNSTSKLYGDD